MYQIETYESFSVKLNNIEAQMLIDALDAYLADDMKSSSSDSWIARFVYDLREAVEGVPPIS